MADTAERTAVAAGETSAASGPEGEGAPKRRTKRPQEKGPRQYRRHKIKRSGTIPEVVLRACVGLMDLAQRYKLFRVSKLWRLCARDSTLWLDVSFRERPTIPTAQLCQAIHWAYDCHHLDLTGCLSVTDSVLAKIGWRMGRLGTLILAGTCVRFHHPRLTGAMERLGASLTHLDISRCHLESLDVLQSLKKLEHFEAVESHFPSLLPLKAVADTLRKLRLSAKFSGWNHVIEVVSAAPNLRGLHIQDLSGSGTGLRLTNIHGLTSFTWAFRTRVGDNNAVAAMLEANAETLEEAEIPASEAAFEALQNCKQLRSLSLQAAGFRRKRSSNGLVEMDGFHSESLRRLVLDGHFEFGAGILQQHPALHDLTITQTRVPDVNSLLSTSWQLTVLKFVAVGFSESSDLTIEDQTNLEYLEFTGCGKFSVLNVHGCPNLKRLIARYCTPLSVLNLRAPTLRSVDISGLHQLNTAHIDSERLQQVVCTRFPSYDEDVVQRLETSYHVVWLVPKNPQPEKLLRDGTVGCGQREGRGRSRFRGRGRQGKVAASAPFGGRWKYWTGNPAELYAPTDADAAAPGAKRVCARPEAAMDED